MIDDLQRKKIRWRCRRGMLELDSLLQPFFDQHFEQLTSQEQQVFEDLLHAEDQMLYDWFLGKSEPERTDFKKLITKIKNKNRCHREGGSPVAISWRSDTKK